MRYDKALEVLAPGAEWELIGTQIKWIEDKNGKIIPDPQTFVWKSSSIEIPTRQQIEDEAIKQQKIIDKSVYQRLRAPEYPPIGDQLDALWKGGNAATEMLARVQVVKDKYPKP